MQKEILAQDSLFLRTQFRIRVYNKLGRLKAKRICKNLVVSDGKGELGDLMLNKTSNRLKNINLGSSSQAPTVSDTDLITPLTPSTRLAADDPGGLVRLNNVITVSVFVLTTQWTRPATVNEIGVFFDPQLTGKLFARALVSPSVTLASGDTARVDYDVTIG